MRSQSSSNNQTVLVKDRYIFVIFCPHAFLSSERIESLLRTKLENSVIMEVKRQQSDFFLKINKFSGPGPIEMILDQSELGAAAS